MGAISAYVPAPFQGITQASIQVALNEQAQVLDNVVVDVPEGLRKRPPFSWKKQLTMSGNLVDDAFYTTLNDPDTGALLHLVLNREGGHVKPYLYDDSSSGTALALTIGSGVQTYLDLNTPTSLVDQFRATQAVDYTILTNRTAVVSNGAATSTTRPYEALIFCKAGGFGLHFTATITPSFGSPINGHVTTPNGSSSADAVWTGTDKIMLGFDDGSSRNDNDGEAVGMRTALTAAGFTFVRQGAVIYISHPTNDFTVSVTDDQGGTSLIAIKGSTNKFSDLPKFGYPNFIVKIAPTNVDDKTGGYYVQYQGSISTGIWKETVGPASNLGIDKTTMPVGLVKVSGSWQIQQLDWKTRQVGDPTLSIDPGFVGTTIQDVGYIFGRIAIVSSEEVFLCAADDPFRIYPASMVAPLESDPFSLQPPSAGRAMYRAITPYKKSAAVIGRKQQSILVSPENGPAIVGNTKLIGLTSFEIADEIALRPVLSNAKVYFPVPKASAFYGFRELALDRISGQETTEDVTAAIPQLLPNTIDRACAADEQFAALYGASAENTFYWHSFRFNEQQRVQNGWFREYLPTGWTLHGLASLGTKAYAIVKNGVNGAGQLVTMEMAPKDKDSAQATILTHLDMRMSNTQVTSSYSSAADETTITIPTGVPFIAGTSMVTAKWQASPVYPEGYIATVNSVTGTTVVKVKGDWTGQAFWVGYKYSFYWTPTQIQYFSPQDNRPMYGAQLRVDYLQVSLSNTGYVQATVAMRNRDLILRDLQVSSGIGVVPMFTGPWRVPVKGPSDGTTITLTSDSHLPVHSTGFEWFGDYNPNARRTS